MLEEPVAQAPGIDPFPSGVYPRRDVSRDLAGHDLGSLAAEGCPVSRVRYHAKLCEDPDCAALEGGVYVLAAAGMWADRPDDTACSRRPGRRGRRYRARRQALHACKVPILRVPGSSYANLFSVYPPSSLSLIHI